MEPNKRSSGGIEPAGSRGRGRIKAVIPAGGAHAASSSAPSLVKTRHKLLRTRLGRQRLAGRPQVLAAEVHPTLVARRNAALEVRRRRRGFIFLVVAAGIIFPPLLAVYFIAWLVWRAKPRNKSMRRVRQGVKALEKEQIGIALQRLQDAHLLDPSNDDALYWLGLLLTEQHRYGEATEALSIVSERVPGLPEVESALAEAYAETGEHQDAIHHAQLLLDIDPYDLQTLVRLANSFEAIGRIDLAIETLQHAPLYKRTLDDNLRRVHYRLGELYERTGEIEKAREHYRRVMASDMNFLDVRSKLETPLLEKHTPSS